ncbi:hypothetical protein RFI_07773 [Reticulomyxa filosa]|uniref:Uncharacterized protein n=1 Tax=Reticulomyxa filosa TaxID=46433 RepID=X6NU87_RETFI|nr:hypothetical protein RFI_07773 [Reticulomyxa filosa]|eukprot:ETO29349.1 hypothetical protein RFI_07773 [Reticulomyxa filosa]
MKERKGSYFEKYHSIIDTLLTLAFVSILSAIYQNGGFAVLSFFFLKIVTTNTYKKYIESKRNSGNGFSWYVELFEKALRNEKLVKMEPVHIAVNHLLLAVIDPQLYLIQTDLQHSFPFSCSIHAWNLVSAAIQLEQIPIGNDDLTQWDMDYSLKAAHEYAMDLVRFEFSWRLHTSEQQDILRNIIVSMALLLCGKLSIATIEVTIHHFRQIILHYAYLISISSKFSDEIPDVPKDQPGQWLMKATLNLWKSIPIRTSFTTNDSIRFFPKSISIVFNSLSKYLQKENASIMNELLQTAREIEIRRLGIIYLETDEFVDEEKYLIEHGFLENDKSVDHVLNSYSNNRNAIQQKYPDFIQDLLAAIRRIEKIEENADKRNVYISILQKLYSQIDSRPIFKIQIFKEMMLHGYLNSDLSLHSEEAVLLSRCLELMILNEKIKEDDENWRQLCDEKNTSDLGFVAKISKVKVGVASLIFKMIDKDIDISQLKENQRILEDMSKLLLDFGNLYKQYEHALHVWFLKQLYVMKGMHWIEVTFTHPNIGTQSTFLKKLKTSNIFSLLRARTLRNSSFNPFVGVYGDSIFMKNILEIMNKEFAVLLKNQSLNIPISPRIFAESLTLIHFHDGLHAYILVYDPLELQKQKIFWQIFIHWSDFKKSGLPIKDTTDIIAITLGFHFVSILPFMKQNPFQLLLTDSESFLPVSIASNESLKVHYCSNGHALLIDDESKQQVKCQINDCEASIVKTISKESNQRRDTTDTKDDWFVLKRFYAPPKKTESSSLKPLISTLLQLLYHLLLFLRNESIPQDTTKIQQLIGQTNHENVSEYLWKKIKYYLKVLQTLTNLNEELLCIAIHLWIKDFSKKFEEWYPEGLPSNDSKVVCRFEKDLDEEYSTFFNSKAKFIQLRNKSEIMLNNDNKWLELMSEIEETKEVDERHETIYIERLFLEVQKFSWRDLFHVFTANPSLANGYPLIAQLLNWDWNIWYLQYLPDIAHLIKYVHKKYSRQLMPDELYRIQKDKIFEQTHSYKKLKNCFVSCWNYFALNHQQLQHDFKNLPIDQVCIIDSNVNNSQFNIYQIIRHLEHQHNEFLKIFKQSNHPHIQVIEEKKENSLSQHTYKYFFDITKHDILCFDKAALNTIIERRSNPILEYGQSDKSKYFDLAAIENDIYHTFIHGRQQITFVIPLFEYRNEFDICNCITTIETKYKVLKCAQFQSFWDNLRLSVASSLQKQRALEMINDAIVHLFQKNNEINIDVELTELFKNLQFEKKDWILFDKLNYFNNKADKLCVKHIGVLWRQLRNSVRSEQLDESSIIPFVLEIYQQPLTNEIKVQIKEFVNKTSLGTVKDILSAWREIAYKQGQIKRDLSNVEFSHLLEQYVSKDQLECFPSHLVTWNYCAFAYQYAYQCVYQEWKNIIQN